MDRTVGIAALLGVITLMPLLTSERFHAIHTVDALQLLASGACFGVAATRIFARLRTRSGA